MQCPWRQTLQLRMHLPCLACLVNHKGSRESTLEWLGASLLCQSKQTKHSNTQRTTTAAVIKASRSAGGVHLLNLMQLQQVLTRGAFASCHPRSPSLCLRTKPVLSHRCPMDALRGAGSHSESSLKMRRDLQLAFRENPSHCRDNGCTYYHVHVVLLWMRVPPARQAAASFIIRSVREADEAFSWRLHLFMLHLGCQFFVRALRETPLGLWRLWRFLWRLSEGREPDLAHGAQATRGKLGMWLNNSLSSVQSHLLQAGR